MNENTPELDTATTGPTTAEVRTWANQQGLVVGKRGSLSAEIRTAYADAH